VQAVVLGDGNLTATLIVPLSEGPTFIPLAVQIFTWSAARIRGPARLVAGKVEETHH